VLLDEITRTSAAVADTPARRKKIDLLAETLRRARPDEVPTAVAYLSGVLPQGTIGVGWASLRDLPAPAAPPPTLELLDVDAALTAIKTTTGPGSQTARRKTLAETFSKATEREQHFLTGLLLEELRQGALEKIMLEAVAEAAGVSAAGVRRALMLAGDLGSVAKAVITEGHKGLARFRLQPLHPIQPMLAQTADDLHDALSRIRPAAVEWKLDGARIQSTGWATKSVPSPAASPTSPSGSRR
jgi:DNA ligase-1